MEIHDLNRTECWKFLGARRLGRLGCAKNDVPYVVPVSFSIRQSSLFAITTVGKKVDYLRTNPRVCVQFDDIASPQEWTSVIVQGQFEELVGAAEQDRAHQLLESAAWWEPGYVRTTIQGEVRPAEALYFRVLVEDISGRRGVASA
jgi:nitroimidazol reductase NimA-like FMN-containing flavoprotein (pyridoxamine 5'-phosphate oxidase superfamily)